MDIEIPLTGDTRDIVIALSTKVVAHIEQDRLHQDIEEVKLDKLEAILIDTQMDIQELKGKPAMSLDEEHVYGMTKLLSIVSRSRWIAFKLFLTASILIIIERSHSELGRVAHWIKQVLPR